MSPREYLESPGCAACAASASAAELEQSPADLATTPGNEMAWGLTGGGKSIPADSPSIDPGLGPYGRLVIRGGTLIDGTGAPPIGPVDIVVEGDRITEVRSVGHPGLEINDRQRPRPGGPPGRTHGIRTVI